MVDHQYSVSRMFVSVIEARLLLYSSTLVCERLFARAVC